MKKYVISILVTIGVFLAFCMLVNIVRFVGSVSRTAIELIVYGSSIISALRIGIIIFRSQKDKEKTDD